MMRQDKIRQIMELAGVAPRDFDGASRNYTSLTDSEIDLRLERLARGAGVISDWRRRRGPAIASGAMLSQPIDLSRTQTIAAAQRARRVVSPTEVWLAAIEKSNEAIDRYLLALTKLIERISRWKPPLRGLLAAEIHAQIAHLAISAEERRPTANLLAEIAAEQATVEGDGTSAALVTKRIEEIVASHWHFALMAGLASTRVAQIAGALHPLMSANHPRLTATGTVDALARLENAVSDYRPDLIVAVNEGRSIAELIKAHLDLDVPIVTVHGSADTRLIWDDAHPHVDRSPVVCVIGHLARTGATMSLTIEQARARYRTGNVFGVVLASSMGAAEHLARQSPFLFHQATEASVLISLGFDASTGVTIKSDTYILGGKAADGGRSLPVPRALLDLARIEMEEEYPVQPLPW